MNSGESSDHEKLPPLAGPEAAEIAEHAEVVGPLAIRHISPRGRVEHLGPGGVKAFAVDVERIGMMDAVQIVPVDRPGAHPGNQLRRSGSVA